MGEIYKKGDYMKKVLVGLLLGLMVMAYAVHDSYAQERGPMGRCFKDDIKPMMHQARDYEKRFMEGMPAAEHPMWRHLMGLRLDGKQKEAIREIRSRVMKEIIKKKADMQIARIELKDLLDKDPVDMNAVEAKLKQVEAGRTEIRLSLIKAKEEVKSKLTPKQRKKFIERSEMEPDMGPPMFEEMRHDNMRTPPPPHEEKEEMHEEKEHMPQ
jgi:Spy/CpxP family protein refolding chaperone